MRILVLIALAGCLGGTKKMAMAPAGMPQAPMVSKLEQEARLEEPITNAQVSRRTNSLSSDVAVRHRRLSDDSAPDFDEASPDGANLAVGAAGAGSGAAPPPEPVASPEQKEPEKLVIEAWLDMQTADVSATVDVIRSRVVASGGRMVSENVQGSGKSASSAALEFRVPPAQATAVTTWLGTLGYVTNKRLLSSDVSKTLFDQELALKNLELTMERLQKLASQSGPIADLLTIEKEMTRVRGEIEAVKGEQRWLLNRVELATITVSISRAGEQPYEEIPEARMYPGPQLATLTLIEPGMRQRTRVGAGINLRLQRYATFELAVFPKGDGGDSRAVLATFGSALYSSYLQDGHRRYLNPYLGVRVGFGYLSGNGYPVIAAEAGIELFKHEYLVIDTSVRAIAYVSESADGALNATLGASVPF
ncbi:MAG TPA: DUF4349 domain-containing protein [Kofleriaceae bacterium]|nr:DUF4349 domain-containing protein [Kofleriaceae bacterium]